MKCLPTNLPLQTGFFAIPVSERPFIQNKGAGYIKRCVCSHGVFAVFGKCSTNEFWLRLSFGYHYMFSNDTGVFLVAAPGR